MNDREKEARTDIYGEFAIWLWGKKIPTEVFKCQEFMRNSPIGEYIKKLEAKEEIDVEKLIDFLIDNYEFPIQTKTTEYGEYERVPPQHLAQAIVSHFTLPKITEEELRGALKKKECHCTDDWFCGCDNSTPGEIKIYNQAIDDCFNSISALLKRKRLI